LTLNTKNNKTMKTLTKTQKTIIESIVKEFEQFNAPINESDPNDWIEFIINSVDEKRRFIDEIRITNESYDKANASQVLEYINQMNAILNVFGYNCELYHVGNLSGLKFAEYFEVKITWNGHKSDGGYVETTDVFFYPNQVLKENTWYLANASLKIYKKYRGEGMIDSLEGLLKYVAEMIINKRKSLIK